MATLSELREWEQEAKGYWIDSLTWAKKWRSEL
jgi:hypothetical protein